MKRWSIAIQQEPMTATDQPVSPEQDELQVVEFYLGEQAYCVEIARVFELVDRDGLTSLPDTDPHIKGVIDLRGETTTIIDPRVLLDLETDGLGERIIIFDDGAGNQGSIGWVVDDVTEVRAIDAETIDRDNAGEFTKGLVKADDEFVIWADIDAVNSR